MIYILSADRPELDIVAASRARDALKGRLLTAGLPALPAVGFYKGNREFSFVTWGRQAEILAIAAEFRQESVLEIDSRTSHASLVYVGSTAQEAAELGVFRPVSNLFEEADADNYTVIDGVRYICEPEGGTR